MPNLDVPRFFTVYELIKLLSTWPAETNVLIAEYGTGNVKDMKNKLTITPLRAEGENFCLIRMGNE